MRRISLRLPDFLHEAVRELVKKDGVSINQFIALAVAEKVSALMTEEYLEARASRGIGQSSRERWLR
jgi:metal-responsive CopG/Arc/MetJ family transcriptional regulator